MTKAWDKLLSKLWPLYAPHCNKAAAEKSNGFFKVYRNLIDKQKVDASPVSRFFSHQEIPHTTQENNRFASHKTSSTLEAKQVASLTAYKKTRTVSDVY